MFKQSIGLIETVGLASAVVAADVAVKSANVELIGYELSNGFGMVTVKIAGDVGSVKAGIDSAIAAVKDMGEVYSYKVIPRLGENVEKIIFTKDTVGIEQKEKNTVEKENIKEQPKPKKPTVQKPKTVNSKVAEKKPTNSNNKTNTQIVKVPEKKSVVKVEIPKQSAPKQTTQTK